MIGGQGALVVSGIVGLLAALMLIVLPIPEASASTQGAGNGGSSLKAIMTPAIMVLTAFFLLLGLSSSGITNFGVVALMSGYDVPFSTANIALTAFLGTSAVGVLAGGYLADRTRRHGQFAAICFAVNAAIVVMIATTALGPVLLISAMAAAGFLGGVIAPSRDMMVRNAAPPGAAGRAFGIVSTGFNITGVISPLLFGWIMDQNMPHWVFGTAAIFMILTVILTIATDRKLTAS